MTRKYRLSVLIKKPRPHRVVFTLLAATALFGLGMYFFIRGIMKIVQWRF